MCIRDTIKEKIAEAKIKGEISNDASITKKYDNLD